MGKNPSAARAKGARAAPPANGPKAGPKPGRTVRHLTALFKSLADEHRLGILFLLAERGEMSVSAIGDELGQSQPAVSHHLSQLKQAGLIAFRRDGKFNYYGLDPDGLRGTVDRLFPNGRPARLTLGGVEVSFKRK